MAIVAASPQVHAALQADALNLETFMRGQCTATVLKRYAFWQSLTQSAAAAGVSLAEVTDVFGADVVDANGLADTTAKAFADVLARLDSGEYAFIGWVASESSTATPKLGVVRAASVGRGELGFLPVLAGLVVAGVVATGAWVLVDAWLAVRKLEADTAAVQARTQAAATAAVARVAQQDPQAAAVVADALERANNSAANVQPSLLAQLAKSVTGAVTAASSAIGGEGGLLLLGLLWLLSRRKQRGAT